METSSMLVFRDTNTPIPELLVQLKENYNCISPTLATVENPGYATEGKQWSPRLEPFRPWVATEEGASLGNTDGDLFVVGALGMGLSEERRDALIAEGLRKQKAAKDAVVPPTDGCERAEDQPLLSVHRDGDGFAIVAVRLSDFAEKSRLSDSLIVTIPAYIGDTPVTRITSEALSRRFTGGVHVRLLFVPDTVEAIGAQAFNSACVETVYLGAGVQSFDPAPFDMATPSPALNARQYLASEKNASFVVQDGCLISRRDKRLLFAASPYGHALAVPQDVRVIGAAALAKGCPPPRIIEVGSSVTRIEATLGPETLLRASNAAALANVAARCQGRVIDYNAVEQNDCWFGFHNGEALLAAGPLAPASVSRQFSSAAHASASSPLSPREVAARAADAMASPAPTTSRLALPRNVKGRPLTSIAARALESAPAVLTIPSTVREIGNGNTCKGTRTLMLPEGLKRIGAHCFCSRTLEGPVAIPASVTSIGKGSFEYAICRLAHPQAEGLVVHITSDQLISCFLEGAPDGIPFDFARYDEQLIAGRGLPDHLGALLHRLAAPFRLADDTRKRIVEALLARADDAMKRVAREGDVALVQNLIDTGFITPDTFARQIEYLRAANRTDCVLFLMKWNHEREKTETKDQAVAGTANQSAVASQKSRSRFAL